MEMSFERPKGTSARISGANDTHPRWQRTSLPYPLTILTNSLSYTQTIKKIIILGESEHAEYHS